jgi:hypothetical protein
MKTILVIGISLFFLTSGMALAGKPQSEPATSTGGLVGFTTQVTTPDVGLFTMVKMCQADYPDSHFCSTAEILATSNVPELTAVTQAWVQPTPAFINTLDFVDVSGLHSGHPMYQLSCLGWQSQTYIGLTVTDLGIITAMTCTEALPVACCAPAQ